MLLKYLEQQRERIMELLSEGNTLRENENFNTMKAIEESLELAEILTKRLNKGNEKITDKAIQKEIAGVLIQIVFLLKDFDEQEICLDIVDKLVQVENKNKRLKN